LDLRGVRGDVVDAADDVRVTATARVVQYAHRPHARTGGHAHDAHGVVERPDGARHVRPVAAAVVGAAAGGAVLRARRVHVQVRVVEIDAGVDDRHVHVDPLVRTVDL